MSRIGLKPVVLPEGVTLDVKEGTVAVKGPKGELSVAYPSCVSVSVDNGVAHVARKDDSPASVTNHGTVRANLANAVKGVHEGFKKELEIQGIGYRCSMRGTSIVLNVGFSHEVVITPVEGVKISAKDDTHITVEGIDRQKVGQTAALIHDTKRPEPYGGKGIRYVGETVILKEGKRAAGGKK
ncbi:MAG: 50S ribosomal protein L6 [Erysipelotrichaceae bacterium]|jgi:large subunit ribosomal protein L6|nr:50S ribosomal protein L6 [Erysipelotrichaceae bacterium]